jgi:hypothetical protein
MNTVNDIREELLIAATRAATAYIRDEYLSPTGIRKTKTRNVKAQESAELEAWSSALWLANGRSHNPHYWRMLIVERAKEGNS